MVSCITNYLTSSWVKRIGSTPSGFPNQEQIHINALYCNMPQCKTAGHIIKTINQPRVECIANVNTTVEQIHHLIPTTTLPPQRTFFRSLRSKRELFDFVGTIWDNYIRRHQYLTNTYEHPQQQYQTRKSHGTTRPTLILLHINSRQTL